MEVAASKEADVEARQAIAAHDVGADLAGIGGVFLAHEVFLRVIAAKVVILDAGAKDVAGIVIGIARGTITARSETLVRRNGLLGGIDGHVFRISPTTSVLCIDD